MEFKTPRLLIFDRQARRKIDNGLKTVYEAVATTLGSRGRNVAIELNWGKPVVLHDGVSVAKAIVLKDPYENMAAQLVIDAANNTNNIAGDGTTTATVLTYAIAHEAIKMVDTGTNPMVIRKGIDQAVTAVIQELERQSKPVNTKEAMVNVATISAADRDIGELIATAIEKVGQNGVVSVQEGHGSTIDVEYKEGLEFERGYISPYLITKQDRLEAVYEGIDKKGKQDFPYVLIFNEEVTMQNLVRVLEMIYDNNRGAKVLIVADDYNIEATNTIVASKINGKPLVAVRSPEFGEHRLNMLTDIAIATGGTVIGGQTGMPFNTVELEHIGRAEKVIVGRSQTIIIGSQGNPEKVAEHVTGLRNLLTNARTEGEKEKAEKRLSKLIGGVAVINVGAPSETEMREKKERIYDAVNATKAAIAEGIVAGGGVSLLRARAAIKEKEWGIGAEIVKKALAYPIRKLLANAGVEMPDKIIGDIERSKTFDRGYNVDTERMVDLFAEGITDPLKVEKAALRNAASIAIMLITTDCMISFERESAGEARVDDLGIGSFGD